MFILLRRKARYFTEDHTKHIFLQLVEHFTVTSTCNVNVSDGSACKVVSLSLKLEL